MEQRQITDREIREYLGHNGVECRVRICRDGTVLRYGSPDEFDRSQDFWVFKGYREDVVREIREEEESTRFAA